MAASQYLTQAELKDFLAKIDLWLAALRASKGQPQHAVHIDIVEAINEQMREAILKVEVELWNAAPGRRRKPKPRSPILSSPPPPGKP